MHDRAPGFSRMMIFVPARALGFLMAGLTALFCSAAETAIPGLTYTNYVIDDVPWSIHVVKIDRTDPSLHIESVHALGRAIGLATMTSQIELVSSNGQPVAAINGDFYQREKAFAGDPRGLQIVHGELISAPNGGSAFWVDQNETPHIDSVDSKFTVTFPDGSSKNFGLNETLGLGGVELYTPTLGATTHNPKCKELILEKAGESAWLPLQLSQIYTARVREVRDLGDTPIASNTMVLAIGPSLARQMPAIQPGATIKISTASSPALPNVQSAIGGGPILVHTRKKQKIKASSSGAFEFSSMEERHPRSAVGWNTTNLFLIEVDGRQKRLSVGMTLEELAIFSAKIGCDEAVSLDGGGSAAVWFNGTIQNSPCDGKERDIANSLVVLRTRSTNTATAK